MSLDTKDISTSVSVASDFRELTPLRSQWNRLVDLDPDATVFQTFEWLEAWWATYGDQGRLLVLSVFEGSRLVGVAPLMRNKSKSKEILFLGDGQADYANIISHPNDRRATCSAVVDALRQEPGWSVLRLRNIPEGSGTAEWLFRICRKRGFSILRDGNEVCPVLLNGGPEPTPATLVRKYGVRRASNYFRRQGRLEVRNISDREEAGSLLEAFFDQHVRRWEGTSTPSLFLEPANRLFYAALIDGVSPVGHLLFSVATLDNRPISFHFGFDFKNRVYWYKPSFEPELARHSPGNVLIEHLLHHVLEHDRRELDFTIGDEGFKQRFANLNRYNLNVRVFKGVAGFLPALLANKICLCLRRSARWLGVTRYVKRWLKA